MLIPKPARVRPRRTSAIAYGLGSFLLVAGMGLPLLSLCAALLCGAQTGVHSWLMLMGARIIFVLAAPWELGLQPLFGMHRTLQASPFWRMAFEAGLSAGLLAAVLRLLFLRLKTFFVEPLPPPEPDPSPAERLVIPPSPSRSSLLIGSALTFAVSAGWIILEVGFNRVALITLGATVLLGLIPFYFEWRRSGRVTKTEIVAAWVWTAIRRLGSGLCSALFLWLAATLWGRGEWTVALVMTLMGLWFLWVAVFGAGYSRRIEDDIPNHRRRQRRYGWRRE